MAEKKFLAQRFEQIDASEFLPRIRQMKEDGYRLVQACATREGSGQVFLIYSFDMNHDLYNIKLNVPENLEMQSITDSYWSAFIYENEIHDLFGIKFKHSALDYQGHFFKVATPAPWNPEAAAKIQAEAEEEAAKAQAQAAAEEPAPEAAPAYIDKGVEE